MIFTTAMLRNKTFSRINRGINEDAKEVNPYMLAGIILSPSYISFDEATLLVGKIHAIICREYKNHVKGRDYYDYLFYIGKGVHFNMKYLENKLKNTGKITMDEILSLDRVKEFLRDRFEKSKL